MILKNGVLTFCLVSPCKKDTIDFFPSKFTRLIIAWLRKINFKITHG